MLFLGWWDQTSRTTFFGVTSRLFDPWSDERVSVEAIADQYYEYDPLRAPLLYQNNNGFRQGPCRY